jgi:hypothetical protein
MNNDWYRCHDTFMLCWQHALEIVNKFFNSIMMRVMLVMDIDTGVFNYHVIGEGLGGKFPISGGDDGSTHVAHLQRKSVIAKHYNFLYFKGCIVGTTTGIGMARGGDNNKERTKISSV